VEPRATMDRPLDPLAAAIEEAHDPARSFEDNRGKEQTSDIPLPSPTLGVLALEAMSRDLEIAELIGQLLVAAINKNMIHKILR